MSTSTASDTSKNSPLSPAQQDLLENLGTNFETGLSSEQVSKLRQSHDDHANFNTIDPPINCPSWICCLLPCIKHLPSMKAFRKLKPDDAEVLRGGRWTRYDAASVVRGDIIHLEEGDVVPADGVMLVLDDNHNDILVDVRGIVGEDKPRTITMHHSNSSEHEHQEADDEHRRIYYGGLVLHGAGTAVVTAVGSQTLLAKLIREGKFPPKQNVMAGREHEDEEAGISLIPRNVV